MKNPKCESVREFLAALDTRPQGAVRLYRGQPCKEPLLPKIARSDPTTDTASAEKKMLRDLRDRGALLLGGTFENDWDLLVLAQHFRMHTRLLDWTTNPLVALWFAYANSDPKLPVFVYVLDAPDDLLHGGSFKKGTQRSPFGIGKTRVLRPKLNNQRIVAQSGWFTAHSFSKRAGRFVALERNRDIKGGLTRFEFPGAGKRAILRSLDVLGVNHQSLFPDIEGLCCYVSWWHRER